jgi:nucleoside-diphosphate-sugar epimerase
MDEGSSQPPTDFFYCRSKRAAEALVSDLSGASRIETTIVRPGDLYGPGDRVVLLPLAGLLESGWMTLIGGGEYVGAFTYVENLADGLILAGTVRRAAGEVYVITDGLDLTWRAYFGRLTAALALPSPRLSIHPWLALVAASVLEGAYRLLRKQSRPPLTRYLVAHLSGDYHFTIAKARRELGYEPAVPFDEAIGRTSAWYREVVRRERSDD